MAVKLSEDDAGDGGIFADINITPFTDVCLVLLIIFMVSSTAMVDEQVSRGMKVNLPEGASKEVDIRAQSLKIRITKDNVMSVNDVEVKAADLPALFKSTVAKAPDTQIVIEGDEGVAYGVVVKVMAMAKKEGLTRVAIATR